MPYLFTLLCSCLNVPSIKTHNRYSITEIQKVTYNSRKQTKQFSEKKNDLKISKLSTVNPSHLNTKNFSKVTTTPIKQNQKIDFFEKKDTEDNLRYRSFSRTCPSAIFNRAMPC